MNIKMITTVCVVIVLSIFQVAHADESAHEAHDAAADDYYAQFYQNYLNSLAGMLH